MSRSGWQRVLRRAGDAVALEPIEHAFHALFAGPPDRRIISVKLRTLPLHAYTGDRGFESISLQRRVCKLLVPRAPAESRFSLIASRKLGSRLRALPRYEDRRYRSHAGRRRLGLGAVNAPRFLGHRQGRGRHRRQGAPHRRRHARSRRAEYRTLFRDRRCYVGVRHSLNPYPSPRTLSNMALARPRYDVILDRSRGPSSRMPHRTNSS
jgi:hypothetical protein